MIKALKKYKDEVLKPESVSCNMSYCGNCTNDGT